VGIESSATELTAFTILIGILFLWVFVRHKLPRLTRYHLSTLIVGMLFVDTFLVLNFQNGQTGPRLMDPKVSIGFPFIFYVDIPEFSYFDGRYGTGLYQTRKILWFWLAIDILILFRSTRIVMFVAERIGNRRGLK